MNKFDLNAVEKNVMDDLKDFQKATVERIDCLYRQGQKRILVSDEVGLGKTLIARGTIAKMAKLRKQEGKNFIKVVYICSNATIADQNIEKLKIVKDISVEKAGTSRLSMQHLMIFNQEYDEIELNKHIQLIPFTPNTSLRIENSQGLKEERALIYVILKNIPEFEPYSIKLSNLLRLDVNNWRGLIRDYERQVNECDEKSDGNYLKYMVNNVTLELNNVKYKNKRLINYLIQLCERKHESYDVKNCIVELRRIFADVSLKKLNPDLIIMDEFQRFKELLDFDDDPDIKNLVSHFFNCDDSRILMLSATPYKMYSTLEEIDQEGIDSHYSEFYKVINFLINSKKEEERFKEIWTDYSIKLKELDNDEVSFIQIKRIAEKELYKNICRTERITESKLADLVDSNCAKKSLTVLKEDIKSYIKIQKILDSIEPKTNVKLDYIKSSPYLMSFMKKNYKLKKDIEKHFHDHPERIESMNQDIFWLDENKINKYEKISWNNARLENLMNHVLDEGIENLLWIPPSKPYYDLNGPFKNKDTFSKTLIFSSWEMVPRMISSLVSYEVERKTIGKLKYYNRVKYFHKKSEGRYPSSRFTFSIKENKPSQMILFLLLYPSMSLANVYNPIDCLNRELSLESIKKEIKLEIEEKLNNLPMGDFGNVESKWNYLAPLLLDNHYFRGYPSLWFGKMKELFNKNFFKNSENKKDSGIKRHFHELENQFDDVLNYIGKIPDGLSDILVEVAIASPAICAYRSYRRISNNIGKCSKFATAFAKKFMDKMNVPESISVIDLNYSTEPYWRNLLKYSVDGNLQAVFDEYVHLLENGLDKTDENKLEIIHNKLLDSIKISTTHYTFDSFDTFKSRMNDLDYSYKSLRTHFAVSFTKGKSDDNDVDRKKSVRNSFNSPFRPFILASTSIGQEGLDFHNYCRRVVHWNLPSNPIDLEQREGRIDRFECLAIRQNIAKRYGNKEFKTDDIWKELFDKAYEKEKYKGCSDLIPYWGLKESEDMIKIERIVPMYPFSSDEIKYDRLKRVLSLYRLTLGQARQEELLELILNKTNINDVDFDKLFINLSPFYKEIDLECEKIKKENNLLKDNKSKINQKPVMPFGEVLQELTTNDEVIASNFNYQLVTTIDYKDYWIKLIDKSDFDKNLFKWSDNCYWISIFNIKMNLARIEMLIHNGYLEVKLYHDNIKHGEELFDYLFDLREEIENELGFNLFWNKKPRKSFWRIAIFVPIDIDHNEEEAINWHLFMAKRFDEIFSEKIREYFKNNPINYDDDLKTKYWLELTNELSKNDIISNEVPMPHTWYCILLDNVPFSECRIELHAYTNKRQIKTSIIFERSRRDLYQYLFDNKIAVEEELGFELEWDKNKGRRYIRKTNKIDIRNQKNWPESIKWHLCCIQKFKKVFHQRIIEFYEGID